MKKLTLNQTWTLCLRMWKWIAKEWKKTGDSVSDLKKQWLKENGFEVSCWESINCFFCVFDAAHDPEAECRCCPGVLVDSGFVCGDEEHSWASDPPAFYAELLRLNRIRKGKP